MEIGHQQIHEAETEPRNDDDTRTDPEFIQALRVQIVLQCLQRLFR